MERRNWIFTFGNDHEFAGNYVKIFGTYEEARAEMFSRFGDKWAFQYSEEAWQEIVDNPDRKWPIEEEMMLDAKVEG